MDDVSASKGAQEHLYCVGCVMGSCWEITDWLYKGRSNMGILFKVTGTWNKLTHICTLPLWLSHCLKTEVKKNPWQNLKRQKLKKEPLAGFLACLKTGRVWFVSK